LLIDEERGAAYMEKSKGVYIISVASRLTGMHPQTLRKYEQAGVLEPSKSKRLRMYSDDDIALLKIIKYLVYEQGLNLAGVKLAFDVNNQLIDIKDQLTIADMNENKKKKLVKLLDECLLSLG
jgi:MerR family transcriptional regulator, heat shock protein HspR